MPFSSPLRPATRPRGAPCSSERARACRPGPSPHRAGRLPAKGEQGPAANAPRGAFLRRFSAENDTEATPMRHRFGPKRHSNRRDGEKARWRRRLAVAHRCTEVAHAVHSPAREGVINLLDASAASGIPARDPARFHDRSAAFRTAMRSLSLARRVSGPARSRSKEASWLMKFLERGTLGVCSAESAPARGAPGRGGGGRPVGGAQSQTNPRNQPKSTS